MKRLLRELVTGGSILFLIACSTAKKKTTPELSSLEGKKVALVSIEAEDTARKIVEVALVNELVQRGTFVLASKQEVEEARTAPEQDPTDWKGIASKTGADYALQAKVLKFEAPVHEGYSTEEVVDSQLAEEQGTDGKTQRTFKVKRLDGAVKVELIFTELKTGDTRQGIAEAQEQVEASAQKASIHLPPSLRFLEKLSYKAFHEFFEKY